MGISLPWPVNLPLPNEKPLLFYRKHHTMKWPWEELAEEARQQSLFEEDDEV